MNSLGLWNLFWASLPISKPIFATSSLCVYHNVKHKNPFSSNRLLLHSTSLMKYVPLLLSLSFLCDAAWLPHLDVPSTYHGILSIMGPMLAVLPIIRLIPDWRGNSSSEKAPRKAAAGVRLLHSFLGHYRHKSSMRTPEPSRTGMGWSKVGRKVLKVPSTKIGGFITKAT